MRILLLILAFHSWGIFAQEVCPSVAEAVASMKLAGLTCERVTIANCSYDQCQGKIPGYSKQVLVQIPESPEKLRLHFHGHKLGVFPEYETNLTSMVNAFGISYAICSRKEIVVFPESSGACADYDRELMDEGITKFLEGVHTATGNTLKTLPLHLSAHSGGGRTIGRFLKAGTQVAEVSLFDGIYNDWVRTEINAWYKSDKKLNLTAVMPGTPYTQMKLIQQKQAVGAKIKDVSLNGQAYSRMAQDGFMFQYRSPGTGKDHYDVLSESW